MEENQNETGKVKPNSKSNIPAGDMDFGTVANDAVAMWKVENWLTLQYITQAEAQGKVDLFNTIIGNRKNDGGDICRTVERKIERGCRVYLNQAVVSQFARQGIPQPVAFAVA